MPEPIDTDTSVHRPASVAAVWAGVLLAPLSFTLGVVALYALSAPDCATRHELLLHAVHATTLLLGGAGCMIAWTTQRSTRFVSVASGVGRGVRTVSRVGVGLSALFVLAMLVQWIPELFFSGCMAGEHVLVR